MNKCTGWLLILSAAMLFSLTLATPQVAIAQSDARIIGTGPLGPIDYPLRNTLRRPGLIDPLCGTASGPPIGSAACDPQMGREWEGTASTDYFTIEPSVISPPNPDVAVGPDDILTIVNRTIAQYPNPNAARYDNNLGTAPVPYMGPGQILPPSSRTFLDVWIGEAALNELCPTFPRSNLSCVIDNASVRYDQMQGRYVVLFTVVDTGLVACNGCAGTPTQATLPLKRKASWVLVVSRWAVGCTGTGGGFSSACVPNPLPAVPGGTGNSEFFTTPQSPGPSQANPNSGGVNSNWLIYYGSVAGASASQANDGLCPAGGCTYGNINDISDLRRGVAPPGGSRIIDCANTAVGDTGRVCYFPSSARVGLDSDNLIITSSVYDDNVPLAVRTLAMPAWEGTRIRVLKKAAIYTGVTSASGVGSCGATGLCPGAAQAGPPALQGDFYDLWGNSTTPYTVDKLVSAANLPGLHYEPVHLRGRPLATYSGNSGLDNAFTTLLGTVSLTPNATTPQNVLYMRTITYSRVTGGTPTPVTGGIPALQPAVQTIIVPAFSNPQSVDQRSKLVQPSPNSQLPTPYLYVGDNRPHRVIAREGHLYDARVAYQADLFQFGGGTQSSTVVYDIVQKLSPSSAPLEIVNSGWNNGRYYGPMFDVPANVVRYGSGATLNLLPSLFVGTTFPPLAPSDPRTFNFGSLGPTALIACKGLEPGVTPSVGAWPGLFDVRCGEDAYDTAQAYRNPISGSFTPVDFELRNQPAGFPNQIVPFGIRGGAATDPNSLGLWLYGAYAKGRLAALAAYGQWGTYVAFYPLTLPPRDPYGNLIQYYLDVPPDHPHYLYVQIGKHNDIDPASRTATTFNPDALVTRAEMARWLMRAHMNEDAITAYLNATGGIFCSFADVACPGSSGTVTNTTGITGDWRYIEAMWRRGYTKGCSDEGGVRLYCPTWNLTRGQMAVFLVRAKMNQVFPTVLSGAAVTTLCAPPGTPTTPVGDQFGLFAGCRPYFSDVPNTHPYFAFIQKIRELRITIGTSLSTPTALGTYSPEATLTRSQLMVFLVRSFFP